MTRLRVLLVCLLFLPGCNAMATAPDTVQIVASSADDTIEQELIFGKLKAAVAAEDFATLSVMEDDFRSTRARTSVGIWKLAVYYNGLRSYLSAGLQKGDTGCQYRQAQFVQRWASADPRSPAPVIMDSAFHLLRAWCLRGDGFADTVPVAVNPEIRKDVAAAYDLLEKNKTTASIDPEYYSVKLSVMILQGVSKAAFHDVIEEATGREPYYNSTYFNAASYYLPNWGGSYEEVEAFARYAAQRTRATYKSAYYARVFWSLDKCRCGYLENAVDWPTMKQAMRDLYESFPIPENGQYFADLSCRMRDGDEGRHYLRALHPEATGEVFFIGLFANCDSQGQRARTTQ